MSRPAAVKASDDHLRKPDMKAQRLFAVLVCALAAAAPALALADSDLENRVARLERILSNQTISDLVLQIQRLQDEVQRLRGRVDVQQHDIEMLQARLTGLGDASGDAPSGASAAGADAGAAGGSAGGASTDEKTQYQAAIDLLKQRRYEAAVKAFKDLLASYPKGDYADNAHFWLGETFYVKQDYSNALAEFQHVVDAYPLSPKVPGAMLKIGYIRYAQGDWAKARTVLQKVAAKFPDTNEAQYAESRLERMAREGH
jgi:tol-pal system protein YbgF